VQPGALVALHKLAVKWDAALIPNVHVIKNGKNIQGLVVGKPTGSMENRITLSVVDRITWRGLFYPSSVRDAEDAKDADEAKHDAFGGCFLAQ
jgi:hypothetical protein